ncbi:MAG TPA: acylphosphatase, partial [Chryseolinea sp.]
MKRHISILVSGRVQGVFYRASAKTKADELGITGFVQNLPDGEVYMEAEGPDEKLDLFKAW